MKFRITSFLLKNLLLAMLFISSFEVMAQASNLEAGIQALEKKEYSSSLRIILPLAEKGDPEAQVFIGYMYEGGLGVQKDFKEAFVWYEKAAAKGQVTAQFNLAYLYKNGLGISRDEKQAAFWYEKAANNGFAPAQNNLAYMYEKGIGVTRNYLQAASWYQKAAEQGHKNAQINLAYLYENGLGVPKDIDKAIVFYERALLATEKLSSDDVKFAQDRLDTIRASLIKKDLIEPRKKVDATAPATSSSKNEIYSEVVVAPDLSQTKINRPTAATPQISDKSALAVTSSGTLGSKLAEKKEVVSAAPVMAPIVVPKLEAPSSDVRGAGQGAQGAAVVVDTSVSEAGVRNKKKSQLKNMKPLDESGGSLGLTKNESVVDVSGLQKKPSLPTIAPGVTPSAGTPPAAPERVAGKSATLANNVGEVDKSNSPPAVMADAAVSETGPKDKKKSQLKNMKPVDESGGSLALTKKESAVDVTNLQKAPSLPASEPGAIRPSAAVVLPEEVTTILNPENLPIYGLDGRPVKVPLKGSLALKGIQNDFEDLDSNFWLAKATVLIVDPANDYQPYDKGGVTVRGYFEPTGGDTSCVTDAKGKCTLISAKIRTNVGSVKMRVYSVSK